MGKKFCAISIIVLQLLGCGKNHIEEKISRNKKNQLSFFFTLVDTFKVPSQSAISRRIFGSALYKDSLLFFCDGISKKIFKYDISRKIIQAIGKQGERLGEYETPLDLYIKNDTLIYSDYSTGTIEYLDFNGNYLNKYFSMSNLELIRKFAVLDNEVFLLNVFVPQNNNALLLSSKGGKYFKRPLAIKKLGVELSLCKVLITPKNISFINSIEFKIFNLSRVDRKESYITLRGVSDTYTIGDKIDINDFIKNYRKPFYFDYLKSNSEINYVICNSFNSNHYLSLFTESGELINSINMNGTYLICCKNDKLFFFKYDYETGNTYIVQYKYLLQK